MTLVFFKNLGLFPWLAQLGEASERKGRPQNFCDRVGNETQKSRRRGMDLPSAYLLPWQQYFLCYQGLLVVLGDWVKPMSRQRKVNRGRSVGYTGDGSTGARKAAPGVLLQSQRCDWRIRPEEVKGKRTAGNLTDFMAGMVYRLAKGFCQS